MSNNLPNDPNMLFSFINMMLRDRYSSLEEYCAVNDEDMSVIKEKLKAAGYEYDEKLNQFISVSY